ncbi:MAG TPA: phage holin family protein, partial [Gaiellaceae bacterium]|nr:phage holin family protein [Gaiellaceae bacterium]
MPRATEHEAKLGASAKQVAEHASALARLEVELATLEVKRKIASLGRGVAFAAAAVLLLLYALGFGLAAAAAGIATELPFWGALLIVTG